MNEKEENINTIDNQLNLDEINKKLGLNYNEKKSNDFLNLLHKNEEEEFVKHLSDKYTLPYIDLRGLAPDPEALKKIKEEDARSGLLAPFKEVGMRLYVAMFDPENKKAKDLFSNLTSHGYELIKFLASHASLEHA